MRNKEPVVVLETQCPHCRALVARPAKISQRGKVIIIQDGQSTGCWHCDDCDKHFEVYKYTTKVATTYIEAENREIIAGVIVATRATTLKWERIDSAFTFESCDGNIKIIYIDGVFILYVGRIFMMDNEYPSIRELVDAIRDLSTTRDEALAYVKSLIPKAKG